MNVDSEPERLTAHVVPHDTDSFVRNICFVWEDGRKAFFNYAYLVSVDLLPMDSVNVMLLYFSGQIVTLKGYQLGLLFDLLLNHMPKTITATNSRYHNCGETQVAVVTEILVKSE
ncbi:hypothetical protein [Spirosoma migulaei]